MRSEGSFPLAPTLFLASFLILLPLFRECFLWYNPFWAPWLLSGCCFFSILQVGKAAMRVMVTFPPHSVPWTVSSQACIHHQRLLSWGNSWMYLYLPSYQGPGRVLWGSPWVPVLEVTVYFGRKPRPGGEPPQALSLEGSDCIYQYWRQRIGKPGPRG